MDIPFLEHVCNAPAPDARSVRSNAARGSAENDDSRRNGPLKRDAFKGNPLWNITLSSKEFSMPVAYITGATSGIGRATAERFIEEGWTVVAMARREERLQELQDAHPGSVHCFKLDVRDKAAVEHVFSEAKERFGAPDVLVNNAGLALGLEPAQACSLDDWDTMVDTNIKGLLYCTRAALPGMVERHSGHVVNLGSIAGTYAYPGSNVYGASKGFVLQFSRGLRCDLHGTGVRVTDVEPVCSNPNSPMSVSRATNRASIRSTRTRTRSGPRTSPTPSGGSFPAPRM